MGIFFCTMSMAFHLTIFLHEPKWYHATPNLLYYSGISALLLVKWKWANANGMEIFWIGYASYCLTLGINSNYVWKVLTGTTLFWLCIFNIIERNRRHDSDSRR